MVVLPGIGGDVAQPAPEAAAHRSEPHSWWPKLHLTPQTADAELAQDWLVDYAAASVGVDGLVVKRLDEPYQPGKHGWLKLRSRHTAEAGHRRRPMSMPMIPETHLGTEVEVSPTRGDGLLPSSTASTPGRDTPWEGLAPTSWLGQG